MFVKVHCSLKLSVWNSFGVPSFNSFGDFFLERWPLGDFSHIPSRGYMKLSRGIIKEAGEHHISCDIKSWNIKLLNSTYHVFLESPVRSRFWVSAWYQILALVRWLKCMYFYTCFLRSLSRYRCSFSHRVAMIFCNVFGTLENPVDFNLRQWSFREHGIIFQSAGVLTRIPLQNIR